MAAIDRDTQRLVCLGGGKKIEHGRFSFEGTALTVELPTCFEYECFDALLTPVTASAIEFLSTDRAITEQGITITRTLATQRIVSGDGSDCIAANDYVTVPVGIVPVTGTITAVKVVAKTVAGGSPIINLGTFADPDSMISDAEAKAMPANGTLLSITAATDFIGNTLPEVTAGDVLVFSTTGGTTSDPAGLRVEIEITPTPTSGLEFSYQLHGL